MDKLGRYDILRVLGKGAMGLVYEARDPNLDRRVAIKTIKVDNLPAEAVAEYESRFRTEARSAARLQHPNIVSVYDSGRDGDTAFLVMEFVEGRDLKQHLDDGTRYTLEQSAAIVADLLKALDYAHRQNIVHRDVKPANLLMVDATGRIKLTDFGVARIQDAGEVTRTKGAMVGTLKYMAPEQVRGKPVDLRADLFAAGVVLYQLITGRRPFDGDSEFAIIHQILEDEPPLPSSLHVQLPPALDAVVERALAKDRDRRFASASEFLQALLQAVGQAEDTTLAMPSPEAGRPQAEGSGASSTRPRTRTGAAAGEASGSTVTQELELVYWKDVKDSADAQDLEGFLARFPLGIYSDLARRRLARLRAGDGADPTATRTMQAGAPAGSDATLMAPAVDAGAPAAASPVDATVVASAVPDPTGAPPGLAVDGPAPPAGAPTAAPTSPPPPPAPPPPAPQAAEPGRRDVAAAAPAAGRRGPLLAAAALVLAAIAAFVGMRGGGSAAGAGAAAPPSSAASALVAPVRAAAAAPSSPAAAPASRPEPARPPAKAVTGDKPAPGKAAAAGPSSGAAAAGAGQGHSAPAVAPAAGPAAGPAQACEGRVLLGYQLCMREQCARPAFTNHPVCVQRREMERNNAANQGAGR